jgi:hypothetical protein
MARLDGFLDECCDPVHGKLAWQEVPLALGGKGGDAANSPTPTGWLSGSSSPSWTPATWNARPRTPRFGSFSKCSAAPACPSPRRPSRQTAGPQRMRRPHAQHIDGITPACVTQLIRRS